MSKNKFFIKLLGFLGIFNFKSPELQMNSELYNKKSIPDFSETELMEKLGLSVEQSEILKDGRFELKPAILSQLVHESLPNDLIGVYIDIWEDELPAFYKSKFESLNIPNWFLVNVKMGLNEPAKLGYIKAQNQFQLLEYFQTNGCNYDIYTDDLIAKLQTWHSKWPFIIDWIGGDLVQGKFIAQTPDWDKFAKEIYEFCPDVVDQGTETVEALALEMKAANNFFLWWD